MTLDELRTAVDEGTVDTVLLAMTDMQGRLQGKRLTATHFLDEVAENDAEGCNYLLAVDVDMNTVDGYALTSWASGYGDFVMRPDLSTLRAIGWHEATVMVQADVLDHHGTPIAPSPRQVLKRQLERLAEHGWGANAATELEFILYSDTYEEAQAKGWTNLTPANLHNVDYSLLGTARVEPLIRRIRNHMTTAGLVVENSKGECNFGQHEINFRYADALKTADDHALFKLAAKEIAAQDGSAITFMAKVDQREGSSCHVHLSLSAGDAEPPFAADDAIFDAFLAGQLAALRELTLLHAPNVNSYKRFAKGSFAPTAVAWGADNRTCALRVVGHGPAKRIELRSPGADVNPYMTLAAMIAAGLHGVERGLELEPALQGSAYDSDKPTLPATLADAQALFRDSAIAREAFGQEVVDHYVNAAQVELDAFNLAVTDWERARGFERL